MRNPVIPELIEQPFAAFQLQLLDELFGGEALEVTQDGGKIGRGENGVEMIVEECQRVFALVFDPPFLRRGQFNFSCTLRNWIGFHDAARPADPNCARRHRGMQNQDRRILGKVTGPRMNFACRPQTTRPDQPQNRPDSARVSWNAMEFDAKSRWRGLVMEQRGRAAVLGDDQIDPAIAVVVRHGAGALLAVEFDARLIARKRTETAIATTL